MSLMTWLRRFSIRSRLIACMALVVGIGTIVGVGMSWQLLSLKGEFDAFTQQEFTATQRMGQLALSLSSLRGHEKAAIITAGDSVSADKEVKAWQDALSATTQVTEALAQAAPNAAIKAQVQDLQAKLAIYGTGLKPTLEMVSSLSQASAAELYQASATARAEADAIEAQVISLNEAITALAETRRLKAANGVTSAITSLWALLLSPGFIFLPLMALTILSITIPLRRAEGITQAIAHGDLTHDIEPRGKDEITHLMLSMRHMQEGLREMVASVRESSESMLTASTQIAAGNQDLSSRTEQTASSLHMGKLEQLEVCGENDAKAMAAFPKEESQYWPEDGRRIAMHQSQHVKSDESKHGATYFLMGRSGKDNGFKATGVAISSIFVDLPHTKSHSHAHPEAYLYALEGDGYSEIGGKRYDWNQGDAIHVPPGMLHHQHFNPFDRDMKELRFEFGVRYWFVDQWKGYVTIDKHLKATTHMID